MLRALQWGFLSPTSRLDAGGALSHGTYSPHDGSVTSTVTTMADNDDNRWLQRLMATTTDGDDHWPRSRTDHDGRDDSDDNGHDNEINDSHNNGRDNDDRDDRDNDSREAVMTATTPHSSFFSDGFLLSSSSSILKTISISVLPTFTP
jgi:hypothetical protein